MLEPLYAKSFRRQYRLMMKRGMNLVNLIKVMDMIINEQPLPPKRNNHPLHGEWKGSFECHIQGDWVIVYEIDPDAHTVTFQRTGSHSELF
jgi:mRNA interferase YafQ